MIDKHPENFQEEDDKKRMRTHTRRRKIRFSKMKQKALAQ